jgi:6-phosphogluconate dehydrogenase
VEALVHQFSSDEEAVKALSELVIKKIERVIHERDICRLALAGGETPRALYERLAQPEVASRIDWNRLHLYWGDERCVPSDHPASNYLMVKETLLDRVDIPDENVHPIDGTQVPEVAATAYEEELGDTPLDIVLLGMGADGHTASLYSSTPDLRVEHRLVIETKSPEVPTDRISLSLAAINAAGLVAFLVLGSDKARRLTEVMGELGRAEAIQPSAMVAPEEGELHWFVDTAAHHVAPASQSAGDTAAAPEPAPGVTMAESAEPEPEPEPGLVPELSVPVAVAAPPEPQTPVRIPGTAQFGVVGLATMGRNLALNMIDNGLNVAGWNLEPELTESAVAESGGELWGTGSLGELVSALERPRKILVMIAAGRPVDQVLSQLKPLLEEGDIVVDGGNSWFEDTRRRERDLSDAGILFLGAGVSGGEAGARRGPCLMLGGDPEGYEEIRPVLEGIAASTESGPCVTRVGSDGAGHFVKLVHNGIEYADMQFIAESYHILRDMNGLGAPELAEVFEEWNNSDLESFLVELSGGIFRRRDKQTGNWLIDAVLDKAGQKGTGRRAAQVALELGIPVPSIAAAIDARVLSSMKEERVASSTVLSGPKAKAAGTLPMNDVKAALYASRICGYAQGMALMRAGSERYGWSIDLEDVARVWKGGCIIRARLLDLVVTAYGGDPELSNLLLDGEICSRLSDAQEQWRRVVSTALESGVPVPGMAASLAYYDGLRSAELPHSLIQAQRDAFGAHTYQRRDDPTGDFVHTDWLKDA